MGEVSYKSRKLALHIAPDFDSIVPKVLFSIRIILVITLCVTFWIICSHEWTAGTLWVLTVIRIVANIHLKILKPIVIFNWVIIFIIPFIDILDNKKTVHEVCLAEIDRDL